MLFVSEENYRAGRERWRLIEIGGKLTLTFLAILGRSAIFTNKDFQILSTSRIGETMQLLCKEENSA